MTVADLMLILAQCPPDLTVTDRDGCPLTYIAQEVAAIQRYGHGDAPAPAVVLGFEGD